MLAKKHEFEYKILLAVCDKEHFGKKFEEGELCFIVSEKFYGGNEVKEEELLEMIKEADSVNLFGNKCVSVAIKNGLVSEKSVKKIKGISHAQIYQV